MKDALAVAVEAAFMEALQGVSISDEAKKRIWDRSRAKKTQQGKGER